MFLTVNVVFIKLKLLKLINNHLYYLAKKINILGAELTLGYNLDKICSFIYLFIFSLELFKTLSSP